MQCTRTFGKRADHWLRRFFDDREREVRKEATNVGWKSVLDGTGLGEELARAFLYSTSFAEEPDLLMRAIEDRIDRFPGLTFEAVTRVLGLQEQWAADERQRYTLAVYNLGGVLVALYRAAEGDSAREEQLLDLFDKYLASDLRDLSKEIRAYERH